MRLTTEITALLTSLTHEQIAALPPAERQRLANECARVQQLVHFHDLATGARPVGGPRSGVLARLRDGERAP